MKPRFIFIIILVIFLIWFLFVERIILAPFILAAIFAYIFNPLINFSTKKLGLPRVVSIILVYGIILGVLGVVGAALAKRIGEESLDLTRIINSLIDETRKQTSGLPDWLSPFINDMLVTYKRSKFLNMSASNTLIPTFSQAVSRVISFFIFLFSGFYFLKDGEKFTDKLLTLVPHKYKVDVEILLRKINVTLEGYLRGELLLIAIVSAALYIALSILGVRFAITLAIFSGIAEIVPVIGPITAGAIATLVVLLTNTANFGLSGVQAGVIVVIIYFVFRQLEDYFVIPEIMRKITKLHPFVIFFAVVAGGHIAGIMGLILAVPTAAVIRLLIEFFFDHLQA